MRVLTVSVSETFLKKVVNSTGSRFVQERSTLLTFLNLGQAKSPANPSFNNVLLDIGISFADQSFGGRCTVSLFHNAGSRAIFFILIQTRATEQRSFFLNIIK